MNKKLAVTFKINELENEAMLMLKTALEEKAEQNNIKIKMREEPENAKLIMDIYGDSIEAFFSFRTIVKQIMTEISEQFNIDRVIFIESSIPVSL